MTTGTESLYPEHDKMKLIAESSQTIGSFLDWAQDEGHVDLKGGLSINQVLAVYFDIDLTAIDEEKRVMLQRLRDQNATGRGPGS